MYPIVVSWIWLITFKLRHFTTLSFGLEPFLFLSKYSDCLLIRIKHEVTLKVKQLIKRSLVQKVGLRKARHYLIKKWNKLTIFAAKSPLSLLIHFTCSSIDHLSLFLLQYFAYRGFSVSRHCTVRHKAVWKGPFF